MLRVLGFLLETVSYLLVGAALLRAYMNWLRINMSSQPGTFVMALTNWLVQPLRQVLPKALARSRLDSASLMAAALLARNPNPSEADVRRELSGNLCRCGTHLEIIDAVQRAARLMAQARTAAAMP